MVTFLPSSLESCGGGHGLCLQLLEKRVCPSSPKKEKVMTMVTSLPSSVESCGGGHGLCLQLLEKSVCPSGPKKEGTWPWSPSSFLQ